MQNEPIADQTDSQKEPQSNWRTVGENLLLYVPSGVYHARIRAGGKLHRQSLKTNIRSIANLRLADFERSLRHMVERQDKVTKGRMTFGDALTLFEQRKNADPTLAPNTKLYYQNLAKALLKSWPGLKALDIRELTKHECIIWAGKFAATVSETAYNNTIGIVKSACEIAIEMGARLDNPAKSLKRLQTQAKPLKLPSSEQWARFVEAVGNGGGNRNRYSQPCAFFVQFCAYGGFRKGEAANILWQDCDFDKGIIYVVEGDDENDGKDRDFRIKNGLDRQVPMVDKMRTLLEEIKAFNARLGRIVKPTDKVMEVSECERSMTRACKEVGMARITHHDLRHLFATRSIETGVDIPTVSRWLGHNDGGALAMRTYGHLRQEHSLAMAKKVKF
ncbi:MAG: tyrosine-type recombinase/integrase [Limisphaerales bacterium]